MELKIFDILTHTFERNKNIWRDQLHFIHGFKHVELNFSVMADHTNAVA